MNAHSNPLNSYSSFFSSGLLALHTPRLQCQDTVTSDFSSSWDSDADESFSPTSPSPSSPIALPRDLVDDDEESMMDVDASEFMASRLRPHRENERRSATPQQEGQTTPMQQSPQAMKVSASSPLPTTTTTTTTTQPRLRRRRSSLTQATSPMNIIRSPTRAAGNALYHHLQIVPSAARSRSGSLSLGDALGAGTYSSSLVGRMRSGSCSDSTSFAGMTGAVSSLSSSSSVVSASSKVLAPSFRSRRGGRRNYTAPMPALRAPPPTAPLPALPPVGIPSQPSLARQQQQQLLRPSNQLNLTLSHTTTAMAGVGAAAVAGASAGPLKSPGVLQTSARARGLSVSGSKLGGDENRIDE